MQLNSGIFIGSYCTNFWGENVCKIMRPLIERSGINSIAEYELLNAKIRSGISTYLEP